MISPDLTTQNKTFNLCDEAATSDLAKRLAGVISAPCLLYLEGDLGAGKTFFVRSLLQSLGFSGKVKSPTYTLMEPYQIGSTHYYHFDLYRIADPEELELLGARDVLTEDAVSFIEWPEKGTGWLPTPDLRLKLSHFNAGRKAELSAESPRGTTILHSF